MQHVCVKLKFILNGGDQSAEDRFILNRFFQKWASNVWASSG